MEALEVVLVVSVEMVVSEEAMEVDLEVTVVKEVDGVDKAIKEKNYIMNNQILNLKIIENC